ncbi:MAG: prolyl oligopeptidase family serine peptidase [Alphaproteobacteria bacterium]|nr:prolyl oligopeptidase family serine peptidase [Alphaproteobacteria bacterium]
MRFKGFGFAVLAAATFALPAAAEPLPLTPLPIEQISRHPAITGVSISPDGKHIAGLMSAPGQRWPVVTIWDLDNLTAPPVGIPSARNRPRSVSFLGNNRVLIFMDQPLTIGQNKTFTVIAAVSDLEGKSIDQQFSTGSGREGNDTLGVNFSIVQAGNLQDPNRYLIARTNSGGAEEILSLDATTMRSERVARIGDNESLLTVDHRDGTLMVKELLVSEGGGWTVHREIRNRQSGAWERHPELSYEIRNRLTLQPLGFYDPDPNKLFVASNRDGNFASVRIYDISTRTWDPQPAFSSPNYDIASVRPSNDWENKKVLGPASYVVRGPSQQEIFVDDYWGPIQRSIQQRFPGQEVDFRGNLDRRHGRAIVVVSSPRNSPAYFVMTNGRDLRLLGRERPTLEASKLGATTFVNFAARDQMNIPAFLTLPPGYDKARHGRIPVVVLPHGGPWGRDFMEWDPSGWTQFLATRGYAVIQPQFRGSSGWGMALWKAGDREWGQKMSDDNDDAAAWLVSQGIADPNRMAIFGYSYGGFAAIAASVRPNSPYRCAISGAGVSDLNRIKLEWGANRIQRQLQGWTVEGMSPLANVAQANIPIMLYHGDRDRQADTIHSRLFSDAMKRGGKRVEYHEIKDMWHQLPWWPEWHTETLGLIDGYLKGPNCFGGANPT